MCGSADDFQSGNVFAVLGQRIVAFGRIEHNGESGVNVGYADGAAFVDGELVPIAETKVSLLDWGFLQSDATYDVAHV